MLVNITVENFKSFDKKEELSMISSSKIQENKSHRIKIKQTNLLKNAVIYGANASGKSNLVKSLEFIKTVIMEGLPLESVNNYCRNKDSNKDRESVFELQFTVGDKFYAYGFAAVLSKRKIIEEWLYELMQDGNANNLFSRDGGNMPKLGDGIRVSSAEKNRFNVYAEDFMGNETGLFLTEMNRGKRYEDNSKFIFFKKVFEWLINNIIIINPDRGISSDEVYYTKESLDTVSKLIETFDTGVNEINTKEITLEELSKMIPKDVMLNIFDSIKLKMQLENLKKMQMTWRIGEGFFNIRIRENSEPEITTIVLKHGKSIFDFSEESDGTKRLIDLIYMLMIKQDDIVFVVDELERSLHTKLTEHFIEMFMESHKEERIQLIFTTHENAIMDKKIFRRDEIWFIERDNNNVSVIYSLDKFKERYDKKLSKAYLEGRYGAIPVFKQFQFNRNKFQEKSLNR